MILDIDNACYGTLSLSQMDDGLNKDTYFVDGEGDSVSFRVGYTILLSSGKKVGKLYTGEVKSVDIENGIIEIEDNSLKVSNFDYFARVGYYT